MINIIKNLFGKGVQIRFTTGRPYVPGNEDRTDPMKQMAKKDEIKSEKSKK